MKNTCRSLFLILCLLVWVAPVHSQTPVTGGTLKVCQPAEPPGLDPTANTAAANTFFTFFSP